MPLEVMTKINNRVRRPIWTRQLRSRVAPYNAKLIRLGTSHGGWTIPLSVVEAGGTAVCVGAGEDISFDVELNKRGFTVYTLDPTPRARQHVERVLAAADGGAPVPINNSPTEFYDLRGFDKKRFHFLDIGVWHETKTMRFFAPKDKNHVSHSIVNLQRTEEYFEARCETLQNVIAAQKIAKIDVLKLDVEGSEYAVVGNLLEHGPLPNILCLEFDEIRNPIDGGLMERILSVVDRLVKAGYQFRHLENSNTLMVR